MKASKSPDCQDSSTTLIMKWALLLQWTSPGEWWQLQHLTKLAAITINRRAIMEAVEALDAWPLDPTHPHGGYGGVLLTEAVQSMILWGKIDVLVAVCERLRRRQLAHVPWTLRSKELVMHAAGHSKTAAPLKALLGIAPYAVSAVCRHNGFTLLHEAAFCCKPQNVEFLLSAHCDASALTRTGETALHLACHGKSAESVEIAELLVAHDASSARVMDSSGLLPIERVRHAQRRRHRTSKSELLDEEICAVARLTDLLEPHLPSVSELPPCCGGCGLHAYHRICQKTGLPFCAICGYSAAKASHAR